MKTVVPQSVSGSMQALVYDGMLRLGRLPRPQPGKGEAVVRVRCCAISRADLDMAQGRRPVQVRPVILGHQFVGEVAECGDDTAGDWVGRRVVAKVHRGCGRCDACRRGRTWLCETSRDSGLGMGLLDGGLAEWVAVPVRSLIELPDTLDDEEAVFVHPVASALEAVRRVQGAPPQRVLVVGDGNMGLLVTLMLHAAGHTVSVFGRHPSRRDLLWRSGISFTGVHQGADSERALVESTFARESFGTVFECSGRVSGFELAAAAVRSRGRIVLLSYHGGQPGCDLRPLVEREIEIHGIGGGSPDDALSYLSRKRVDMLPLVQARLPLGEGVAAFEQAARRGALKFLLENRGEDAPRRSS